MTYFRTFTVAALFAISTISAMLASGCALRRPAPQMLDLGPATMAMTPQLRLPPLRLMEVEAPPWLDEPRMFYRLMYENPQQARIYTASRWLVSPGKLVDQRLRQRLTAAGGIVLPSADSSSGLPVLRIELDDFVQNFSSPSSSSARVVIRASLYTGYELLAQNTFYGQVAAASADATGGVRALASASDVAIDALSRWLAAIPLND